MAASGAISSRPNGDHRHHAWAWCQRRPPVAPFIERLGLRTDAANVAAPEAPWSASLAFGWAQHGPRPRTGQARQAESQLAAVAQWSKSSSTDDSGIVGSRLWCTTYLPNHTIRNNNALRSTYDDARSMAARPPLADAQLARPALASRDRGVRPSDQALCVAAEAPAPAPVQQQPKRDPRTMGRLTFWRRPAQNPLAPA
jgi:hypothetical protein